MNINNPGHGNEEVSSPELSEKENIARSDKKIKAKIEIATANGIKIKDKPEPNIEYRKQEQARDQMLTALGLSYSLESINDPEPGDKEFESIRQAFESTTPEFSEEQNYATRVDSNDFNRGPNSDINQYV